MISAACESAEKALAETRKAYGFGTRQGPSMLPTMDKGQAAKIQEQENMLRAAVNDGTGKRLRILWFGTKLQLLGLLNSISWFFYNCVSRIKIASRPETNNHCTSTTSGRCADRCR